MASLIIFDPLKDFLTSDGNHWTQPQHFSFNTISSFNRFPGCLYW